MEWLNYHHLYYFWVIAHEGSIAKAAQKLKLSQPTLSAQVALLESCIKRQLFKREGRGLILTETGRFILNYADEIFRLGHDMLDALADRPSTGLMRMQVGIADVVPKAIAYQILKGAFEYEKEVSCFFNEGKSDALILELAAHRLDMIITESPIDSGTRVKAYSHLLGESQTAIFGSNQYKKLKKNFPRSLTGQPFLLPSGDTHMRRQISSWFDQNHVKPTIKAEFTDSSMVQAFGEQGVGLYFAPLIIAPELKKQGVELIGRAMGIKERYYAITVERKIKHPVVYHLLQTTRESLF